MSKVTLNGEGTVATIAPPTLMDPLSTLLDPDVGLTGLNKYVQMVGAVAVGALIQNMRLGRGYNFITVA